MADQDYLNAVDTAFRAWGSIVSALSEFQSQHFQPDAILMHHDTCKMLFAEEMEQRSKLLGTMKTASDDLVANLIQSSEQIVAKRRWSPGLLAQSPGTI